MKKQNYISIVLTLLLLLCFSDLCSQNMVLRIIPNQGNDTNQKVTWQYYTYKKLIDPNYKNNSNISSFMLLNNIASKGLYGILKGTVVDPEGNPMIGSTVRIIGTTWGAIVRDKQGRFTIVNIKHGKYRLEALFTGYDRFYSNIEIFAGQTVFTNIIMNYNPSMVIDVILRDPKVMINNYDIGKIIKYSGYDAKKIPGR